jgi:hypothetical protein
MSQYEVYDGPRDPHSGGFAERPAYDSSDRYGEHSAATVVLAKVPDLDEASEPRTISLCQAGTTPRGSTSGFSTRSIVTTAALMFLAAVAGFMLGRSGRVESTNEPDAWRPPPPAESAPEAPAWKGASALGSQTSRASSDFALPGFSGPPPAMAMPAAPAGSPGTTPMPTDVAPTSTPWSYPGTTNVPAADQNRFTNERARAAAAGRDGTLAAPNYSGIPNRTQTEANRGMTLEAPAAPANNDRGTQYRSGYGPGNYGATSDPRMASRPQTRILPAPPAQGQYPTTSSPAYPQTVYPDTRSQQPYPDTRSIPNSTPYRVYPSTVPSTTPR